MNAAAPARGLGAILKSLNCDRAYGWTLLAACVLLALPELCLDGVGPAVMGTRRRSSRPDSHLAGTQEGGVGRWGGAKLRLRGPGDKRPSGW